MDSTFWLLLLVIGLALIFDYINGFHDAANAVATVVSTNVLPGRTAVLLAGLFNFIGAFMGVGVAKTIGSDITNPAFVTQSVVAAALLGAIFWNLLTWYYGIPSSSSHAMLGGIVGAVWCHQVVVRSASAGWAFWELFTSNGVQLALIALVLSPLIGLICGFSLMIGLLWMVRRQAPSTVNRVFRVLQLISAGFMALSHGSNDAQKSMGVITMALIAFVAMSSGQTTDPDTRAHKGALVSISESEVTIVVTRAGERDEKMTFPIAEDVTFQRKLLGGPRVISREEVASALADSKGRLSASSVETDTVAGKEVVRKVSIPMDVPWWVITSCAIAIGLGTASGGWRIMKTMGHKIIRLRPINGFAAESAAAAVILAATALHAPVSTTHVISASIMGVGASKRVSAVRWGVAGNILIAWILTIPVSAVVAALIYLGIRLVLGD